MPPAAYPPPPLRPYDPLLVNLAPTGMVPMPERVPHVPVRPDDIVREVARCYEAGVSVVHVHARGGDARPVWEREVYADIIPAIRERCPDIVVCATTSGRTWHELEKRSDVLSLEGDARPDMGSLTLGSMNFPTSASVNAPETIEGLARIMKDRGIRPELEVFDVGMAYTIHHLADRGVLEPPFYVNILLGSQGTAPALAGVLAHVVDALPEGSVWAAAGIGAYQLPMNAMAVFMGGHVRVGIEDNPYLDQATKTPATNSALVRRVTGIAATAGRRVARPDEVRRWLGLEPREGRKFTLRPAVLPADRGAMLGVLETSNMHLVPSAEMHDLDIGTWYVAEMDGRVVGVCGFDLLHEDGETVGKTTLLTVLPDVRRFGVGRTLQELRMGLMRDAGARRVITNADRPETIEWYERHFGYRKVGTIPKVHEFGRVDVDHWTTLEAPLA